MVRPGNPRPLSEPRRGLASATFHLRRKRQRQLWRARLALTQEPCASERRRKSPEWERCGAAADLSTGFTLSTGSSRKIPLGATRNIESCRTFAAAERPSGNGVVLEATTTAEAANIRKDERPEADGTGGKGRSARRKPNPLSRTVRRNRSLRAKEPRREPGTAAMPEKEPGSEIDRSRKISMEFRSGNRTKPQGIERNPRDRPGPKGSGRNPSQGKRLCPHRLRTWP